MTASQQREFAIRLVKTDPDRALAVARSIHDPWFACQALAWVARFSGEERFLRIIKESFKEGRKATDPYRVVAAAAWPVRALVERGKTRSMSSVIPELLVLAQQIELFASRSEALFLLFQAVFPAGREIWFPVLQALRNLRDAVCILRSEDERLAVEIFDSINHARLRKQIAGDLAKSERRLPRPFFWK